MIAAITDHRRQYESKHGVINNGAGAYATRDQWDAIAAGADDSARRQQLADSALLKECDELNLKAQEALRIAKERRTQLNALHAEYAALPDRISNTQREVESINNTLKELNVDTLKDDYRRLFRAVIDGGQTNQFAEAFAAAAIGTCELKREVLTAKASEIETSLVEMRRKLKELRKKLS